MKMFYMKASLQKVDTSVWRTFEVSENLTFEDLHHILQTLSSYLNREDYEFFSSQKRWRFTSDVSLLGEANFLKSKMGQTYLSNVDIDKYEPILDVEVDSAKSRVLANELSEGESFFYLYDFTDEWLIKLSVLDVFEGKDLVCLIDGFGSAPYEGVGGLVGYEHLMSILSNPNHSDYDELRHFLYEQGYRRFDKEDVALKLRDLAVSLAK